MPDSEVISVWRLRGDPDTRLVCSPLCKNNENLDQEYTKYCLVFFLFILVYFGRLCEYILGLFWYILVYFFIVKMLFSIIWYIFRVYFLFNTV
jgi:hypothetical protein